MRRAMALVVMAFLALIPCAGALAAPPPLVAGTPVLGQSLLSAEQLAGWYASTGVVSRSPTDVGTLAALFVDEGAAQGVRADLAFAQSMLETGYLRFGGLVRPSDNNFSGLGACDSCPRGLAFPTAQLGVRAQIQHLWAYATPGADPALLARPLVSPRFHLVQPPGKAPLWETMGGGNWATDPDYAGKVLRIWRSMLAWAGVPEPAPSTGDARPLIVRTAASGAANLGGWPLR
ncbi:MAG: glucosaminidase domain-containing protein, partial [Thermoleophilia bacterium]|nr:glucosaminidase domain-containing protein [Thermoleophilia bacterium]